MTDDGRRSVLERLSEMLPALRSELEGLTSDRLTYHPAPGAWSILDCVEHIATAESVMFVLIARRSPPVASPAEGREDKYFRGSLNRARKFSAPDSLRPSQRYASLEAALDAFANGAGAPSATSRKAPGTCAAEPPFTLWPVRLPAASAWRC